MKLFDKLRRRAVITTRAVSPSDALAELLEQVIAELSLLNRSTEQDFLRIGEKLFEFMESVRVISSELTALANSDHGQQTSQALTIALHRSQQTNESLVVRDGGLSGMHRDVGSLRRTLSGFQGTVSSFHTLGLLTRIETARLGNTGADFSGLADEVDSLAKQVHARVESSLTIADSLIPPIEDAMRELLAVDEGQAKDLPVLISETLAGISAFRETQSKARESSIRLGIQYDAISDAFKKLIVSIQFHDITRQQVEHVIQVLQRLSSDSGTQACAPSRSIRTILAVLALQSAQLADAGEKFSTSVETVERNLEDITRHVLDMAAESQALSGLSDDGDGSFFLPMEQNCGAILSGLSRTTNAEAANLATRKRLSQTIGQLRAPVEDIQKIEIEIRRMALNASIKACHLGRTGSALDVLAGSVQQLASDCRERSELLVKSLSSMTVVTDGPSDERGPDSVGEPATEEGFMNELRQAVVNLRASTESNFAMIIQIAARGDSLARDLAATRESFSVGKLFEETVLRARSSIKGIGEKALPGLPLEGEMDLELELAGFVGHYTMQAERDVHEAITGAVLVTAPVSVAAKSQGSPSEAVDELWDNVELF